MQRWAVYWAPPPDSALARFGAAWLGRDAAGGEDPKRPALPGIGAAEAEALTAAPRFYGLHGTLKPPFALTASIGPEDVTAEARRFADFAHRYQIGQRNQRACVVTHVKRFQILGLRSF